MNKLIKKVNAKKSILIGFSISGICLWLVIRKINVENFLSAFTNVTYSYVLVIAVFLALGLTFRAIRWRIVAGDSSRLLSVYSRATNIGILSNMILPLRAGELVRIATFQKLSGAKLATPVVSALVDRFIDIFVLLLCTIFLYAYFPVNTKINQWLFIFIVICLVLVFFTIVLLKSIGKLQAIVTFFSARWLKHWHMRLETFITELKIEFNNILKSCLSIKLILIAILVLLVDYIAVLATLFSFNLELPNIAALLLWVFLALGSALPSAPGYVGVYQIASILALSYFSVEASMAVAVASVLQFTTFMVVISMIGLSFVKESWKSF